MKRVSSSLFLKYIKKEKASSYILAKLKNKSEDTLQRDLKKSLLKFSKETKWPELKTDENIIVVADAMMIMIEKKLYTFYFILLRPILSNRAIVTEAFVKEGSETCKGW